MTDDPSFDQKNQSVKTQTNIDHVDQVIIQPSGSAAAPLVPHQIRRPPPDFKGRKDEIRDLIEKFDSGATVIGVRGLGGIGKTALALVLVDELKDRFPDGQLFLDMQGMSKSPLKPDDAMAHIIRSYRGADAPLPVDLNGLAGLYHSVLSGKKALILLDNAASRDQVEPLLPPAGSALLITSRDKFALAGLKEKDLGVLLLEDAKKLLLEIAGRIGEHAGELAMLCNCLPLALRNAAYALKEKPNLGVTNYVKKLGDARKRLELVEASFDLSYQFLPDETKRLWCLLSVFPADFDLAGAAAVWEMEKEPVEEVLSELFKWSLVDYLPSATGEGGRYRLHDLARDFAASRLADDVCELARKRHSEFYINALFIANELYKRGNKSTLSGLKLFDCEEANIRTGQAWAKEKLENNDFALNLCKMYPDAGAFLLHLKFKPSDRISWLECALIGAQKTNDKDAECAHLGNIGQAYADMGDAKRAIEYYEKALRISQEIGDTKGEEDDLNNLGNAYALQDDHRKAIECFEQALVIARNLPDKRGEGYALGNIGIAYKNLGVPQKGIEYYEQALTILREIGDKHGEGKCLGNLGSAYFHLGYHQKAIEHYKQPLAITRLIGDRRGEGNALFNMSISMNKLGQKAQAIDFAKSALKIYEEIESPIAEQVKQTLAGWQSQ
jgi:tetratricopeptide (TPR) repeat protein